MSNTAMIDDHFATAMGAARHAMEDLRWHTEYAHVFRACYFEYDANNVPATGKAIHAAFSAAFDGGQKMPILKTPLDCQCFLGIRGNDVYRALHDWDHYHAYKLGIGGTTKLQDEDMLNRAMVERIMQATGVTSGGFYGELWAVLKACLLAGLVGQSYYYAQHKNFVRNDAQLEFVRWTAEKILGQVFATWTADFSAIAFPDFS